MWNPTGPMFDSMFVLFNQDFWNENCSIRVRHFWLIQNGPGKLLAISMAYLIGIWLGKRLMFGRRPLQIRSAMFLYNICMVLINQYFFYKSFWWTDYGRRLWSFRFDDDDGDRANAIVQLYYYYEMSKFLDYVDTLFLVLRKKTDHITALHVYHHVSVPVVGWLCMWINPTMPALGLFAMLNSLCHTIMYVYYAVTAAFGPRSPPFLFRCKPFITRLQLAQFIIIGLYGVALNVLHHGYPLIFRILIVSQAIIYLVMFSNFYRKSYQRHRQQKNDAKCQ